MKKWKTIWIFKLIRIPLDLFFFFHIVFFFSRHWKTDDYVTMFSSLALDKNPIIFEAFALQNKWFYSLSGARTVCCYKWWIVFYDTMFLRCYASFYLRWHRRENHVMIINRFNVIIYWLGTCYHHWLCVHIAWNKKKNGEATILRFDGRAWWIYKLINSRMLSCTWYMYCLSQCY